MKRSFKLATVFTGVGAATGIFAPAALAAPTHTTAAAKPDIGNWKECGANNGGVSTWVHIFYPKDDHPAECIGGAGSKPANATIFSFCAGNNNGIAYGSRNGTHSHFGFVPGDKRAYVSKYDSFGPGDYHLSGIYIKSFTGKAQCT